MSTSCSDCLSDLLCCEDSNVIFSGDGDYSSEYSSDLESPPPEFEESIAGLLEDERDLTAGISSHLSDESDHHQPIDASVRAESVAWILKVQRFHGLLPLTAYLAVSYFDRFLYSHHLPKLNGWPLQLLSVACLSLAAKMEESLIPSLLDLQVEGAKFIFEPRNIQKMELLVLRVLDWRLRLISPFCYLRFFALKIDPVGTCTEFLTSTTEEIILSTIKETSFFGYRPSCIAAAALLCSANDLPKFSLITAQHAESWCDGLDKESIMSCQRIIGQIMSHIVRPKKQPKVLPQLRVMPRPSPTLSDSASLASCKRRKLGHNSWADDEKESLY